MYGNSDFMYGKMQKMSEVTSRKYYPVSLANYFVDRLSFVDNVILNKLVYITYGIGYALYDREFFEEEIQAWMYGPVIPSIYHAFKGYGFGNITDISEYFNILNPLEKLQEDKQLLGVLKSVKDEYGSMDRREIVERTHALGTPWYKYYKKNIRHIVIPKEEIKNYYMRFLDTEIRRK